eukprot:jgi/Bigna1/145908/aug1.105_g20616
MTSAPLRCFCSFPLVAFVRRPHSVKENVEILTSWCAKRDQQPTVLKDMRDGLLCRKRFSESKDAHCTDSKFNIAISPAGDGVQKSSLTDKSVFPIAARVESTDTSVKMDDNLQRVCAMAPGDCRKLDVHPAHLSSELKKLRNGIVVDVAGIGERVVKASVVLLGGDLRALQPSSGKHRDPALAHACPNCDIRGVRHGLRRTVCKDGKREAGMHKDGDSLGNEFKSVPVLGHGIPHVEETLSMCFAHNVKNGSRRMFGMHGNVGKSAEFTEKLRSLEPDR